MSENTKIAWATHSFSPWIGCSKVHTGCKNCYAEAMAGRLGVTWGPDGTRRRTAESTWKQAEKWNRQAACNCDAMLGKSSMTAFTRCPQHKSENCRPRVFPSLCDVFEEWDRPMRDTQGRPMYFGPSGTGAARCPPPVLMSDVRHDFFALIDRCPNLDFLLLTKRPENVRRMWPHTPGLNVKHPGTLEEAEECLYRDNCWLLYSASDQASLEAGLPHLLACRDLVPVLGLSLEPLVGPVDLDACWPGGLAKGDGPYVRGLDWVIVGGESGPHARPCDIASIYDIVAQCKAAGVPCFVKQLGAIPSHDGCCNSMPFPTEQLNRQIFLKDSKGGDPDEWPEDLRVREFPR